MRKINLALFPRNERYFFLILDNCHTSEFSRVVSSIKKLASECEKRGNAINVLECKSVSKWYGEAAVLKNVNFDLAENEIHAIVGKMGRQEHVSKIISGLVP